MRQVKAGCDLSSMERIPSPVVHIPPQLGMMMMRPGFFPMMPMPRAPFGLGGMVRPQQMGGIPPMVSASVVEWTLYASTLHFCVGSLPSTARSTSAQPSSFHPPFGGGGASTPCCRITFRGRHDEWWRWREEVQF